MHFLKALKLTFPIIALGNVAGTTQPTVYLFGTLDGASGNGANGSECELETFGNSTIAFNTAADGQIIMTGLYINHQDKHDLIHSVYYGVASFTPASPTVTFEGFESTEGGPHYPIFKHDYKQSVDQKGNVSVHMRLKLNGCALIINAKYHPLGGAPIFP